MIIISIHEELMFIPIRFVTISKTSLHFFQYNHGKIVSLYEEKFRDVYGGIRFAFKLEESYLIIDKSYNSILILDLRSHVLPFKKLELTTTTMDPYNQKSFWLRDDQYCFSISSQYIGLQNYDIDKRQKYNIDPEYIADLRRFEITTKEKIQHETPTGIMHSRRLSKTSLKRYGSTKELTLDFKNGNIIDFQNDQVYLNGKVLFVINTSQIHETRIISQDVFSYTTNYGSQLHICTLRGETYVSNRINIVNNYYTVIDDSSILAIDNSGLLVWYYHRTTQEIERPLGLNHSNLLHLVSVGYDIKQGVHNLANVLSQIPSTILELIIIPYCLEINDI